MKPYIDACCGELLISAVENINIQLVYEILNTVIKYDTRFFN